MLKHGNDFNNEVLDNKKVVLVDFFATWCGPCKMIAPTLEKIASEHDEFDVVKVDVDQHEDIAFQYGIQSVPTLMVFKNGEVVETMIGLSNEEKLLNTVKKHMN